MRVHGLRREPVDDGPLASTVIRILLAALALYVYMRLRGHRLPVDRRSWAYFFAMAIVGNALPFFLSTWGQLYIDSGLAGILMAVMPLSVLLLAHWFLPDEPMTRARTVGFLVGPTASASTIPVW